MKKKVKTYKRKKRKTSTSKTSKRNYGRRKGKRKGKFGGIKKGWYKGYWCDSSWELAFVIYNLENNIEFERNTEGFPYLYYKKKHLFYPDFIVDGEYVEIKGIMNRKNKAKIAAFPHDLTVLMEKEMQKYLDYAIKKYGEDFYSLYEEKPKK